MYLVALIGFYLIGRATPATLIKGVVFLNVMSGSSLATLWFVEMLCWFYLATPLLLYRGRVPTMLFIGATISLLLLFGSLYSHRAIDIRLALYFPVFVIGTVAGRSRLGWPVMGRWLPVVCSLLVIAGVWLALSRVSGEVSRLALRQVAMLAALVPLFKTAQLLAPRLPSRVIFVLSYCSYGAYVLHRLVFDMAVSLYQPKLWWTSCLYLLFLCVPAIFLAAGGLQWASDRLWRGFHPRSWTPSRDTHT
jgi:peptidoglycan/LPS O-acetylase OafA/YrhL